MNLLSTRGSGNVVTFTEAVDRGMAVDGGLFMPARAPALPPSFFRQLPTMPFKEIAFQVAREFLAREISDKALRTIIDGSATFPAPVHRLDDTCSILELFHGPTLAFKDFGARFMARTMEYIHRNDRRKITILVATSGDTGSAVAQGFAGATGLNVVILYPSGRVSPMQEMQLTTVGGNIQALEVDGSFDDCQRLVKQAFADRDLARTVKLSSANSINIARLLPQMFYYFGAVAQAGTESPPLVFAVPSGNFGNLTAGLLAWKMGLPVARFIAATNVNDVVPEYLRTGEFHPRASVATISNAMDVGNPSNFERMQSLFGHDLDAMRKMIGGYSFADGETREAIRSVHERFGYVMDPHGAVGYLAAREYLKKHDVRIIVLATAHPAKFLEVYEPALRRDIEIPERLKECLRGTKRSVALAPSFEDLKSYLTHMS